MLPGQRDATLRIVQGEDLGELAQALLSEWCRCEVLRQWLGDPGAVVQDSIAILGAVVVAWQRRLQRHRVRDVARQNELEDLAVASPGSADVF